MSDRTPPYCPFCYSEQVQYTGLDAEIETDDQFDNIPLYVYACPKCDIEFASDIEPTYPPTLPYV